MVDEGMINKENLDLSKMINELKQTVNAIFEHYQARVF